MRASHNEFRLSFQNSRTPRDILKKHFQSSEFEIKFNGRSASECWRGKFFEERRFVKKDLKSFAQTSLRGFWIFEFLKISDNFRYNFRENRNGHWKWPIFRPKITRVFEKSADRLKYSRWSQDYKFTQFRVFSFFEKSKWESPKAAWEDFNSFQRWNGKKYMHQDLTTFHKANISFCQG